MTRLLALAASLALPAAATAHDLWVERAPGGFVLRYGAPGEPLAIDGAKVKAIRCHGAAGAARDLRAGAAFAPTEVRFEGACQAVSVLRDDGYWSLTPDGEVNRPRGEVKGVVRAWAARQYAKWLDARSPRAGAALGDELEIVPVPDLARARAGDEVTLRVVAAGTPVPDAAVEKDERPLGKTDANGELRVRLGAAGSETVAASVKRPHRTPQADADLLEATLTFEVAR